MVPYENRVQQGDSMIPILFLFVMQAVKQTLKNILPAAKFEYRYFPNDKGHLLRQRTKLADISFHVHSLLFTNDGAFLFQNYEVSEKAAQIMYDHFVKFRLQMHISTKTSKPKQKQCISPFLKDGIEQENHPPNLHINQGLNSIPAINKGAILIPELKT